MAKISLVTKFLSGGIVMILCFSILLGQVSNISSNQTYNNVTFLSGEILPVFDNYSITEVSPLPQNYVINISINLKINVKGAENYLKEVSDVNSPLFHKFLTPDQFLNKFGPTLQETGSVESWLIENGINHYNLSYGDQLNFSTTTGHVEKLFSIRLNEYRTESSQFYANPSNPSLPEPVANDISSVGGLNNYPILYKQATYLNGYWTATPQDIYNYAPYDFKDLFTNGVTSFWTQYGISPMPSIRQVSIDSMPSVGAIGSGSFEETLDAEWSGTTAPGSSITVVTGYSPTTAEYTSILHYLVYTLDPNIISASTVPFGEASYQSTIHNLVDSSCV